VDGAGIRPGDVLLGFPSTGLHTNGFSLARRVLLGEDGVDPESRVPGTSITVADALLAVHRSYRPVFQALRGKMKGAAHITGGGIPGNLNRVLPPGTGARVDVGTWGVPPLFRLIAERGQVPRDDLYRAFNMGIGLVTVVAPESVEDVLAATGGEPVVIGSIVPGDGKVEMTGEVRW
jgi:phosphoribosylformylglycinamidine cyclo-ligase